jgi:FtsH-binding integral membrane protein
MYSFVGAVVCLITATVAAYGAIKLQQKAKTAGVDKTKYQAVVGLVWLLVMILFVKGLVFAAESWIAWVFVALGVVGYVRRKKARSSKPSAVGMNS